MTLRFVYFQYLNLSIFIYSVIPMIVSANFAIIISIFLFRAHKYRKETIQASSLLKVAGILIIVFNLLPFVLPSIQSSLETTFEAFILSSYILFFGVIGTVPFLIAYGTLLCIYGQRNKREYNVFILIAGILWVIYGVSIILQSVLSVISILYEFTILPYNIYNLIRFSFSILSLNAFILLIIHGAKNNDKNLMVVGILGLTAFITNMIYSNLAIYIVLLIP